MMPLPHHFLKLFLLLFIYLNICTVLSLWTFVSGIKLIDYKNIFYINKYIFYKCRNICMF